MDNRKQVVLVSLTLAGLEDMLGKLDFSRVELLAFVTDSNDDIDVRVSGRRVPFYDFSELDTAVREMQGNDIYWLVCGCRSHLRQFGAVKRMLESLGGIDRQRIINISLQIEAQWWSAYKRAMQGDLDFFATGISYMMAGLSVEDMPLGCGVNLAASSQDIYYSLEIAKRVLPQNPKIGYAFIGLSPYAFSYSLRDSFSTSSMSTVYELMWNSGGQNIPARAFFKPTLLAGQTEDVGVYEPAVNLKDIVLDLGKMLDLDRELQDILPGGNEKKIANNKKYLKAYIDLCRQYDCLPVGVVMPMSPLIQKNYPQEALREYRSIVADFALLYDFVTIDLWDMELPQRFFYDLPHLNRQGAKVFTQRLYEEMKGRMLIC